MQRPLLVFFVVWIIFVTVPGVAVQAETSNRVTGTLTFNQDTFELKHVYAYEQDDELVVCLTDHAVSQDNCPFDLGDLAYEGKIHGFSIGISKSKKTIITDSAYNAVYHEAMLGRGAFMGAGKLRVNAFEGDVLDAVLTLETPGTFPCYACEKDHTYAWEAGFSVALGSDDAGSPEPLTITVTGDDTPAGKAYATYYKAKMTGDLDAVRQRVVKQNLKDLEGEMGKMMIQVSMFADPKKIQIEKTEVTGDTATLVVKGMSDQKGMATGNVKMRREDGQWKVEMDKWKFK